MLININPGLPTLGAAGMYPVLINATSEIELRTENSLNRYNMILLVDVPPVGIGEDDIGLGVIE